MKNKTLLLVALSAAAISFSSDWSLDASVGYNGTFKNIMEPEYKLLDKSHLTAAPTLPINLKLALHPSDMDFNWSFEVKNEKLDGLFQSNKLSETEVVMKADYKTPAILEGLKLKMAAELKAFKGGDSGNLDLVLGPHYNFKGTEVYAHALYNSNKLVTPKFAGAEAGIMTKYVDVNLKSGYDFDTLNTYSRAGEYDKLYPITSKLEIKGKYSNDMLSYKPEASLETKVFIGEKIDQYATTKITHDVKVKPIAFETSYKGLKVKLNDELRAKVEHDIFQRSATKDVEVIATELINTAELDLAYGIKATDKITVTPNLNVKSVLSGTIGETMAVESTEVKNYKGDKYPYATYDVVSKETFKLGVKTDYAVAKDLNLYADLGVETNVNLNHLKAEESSTSGEGYAAAGNTRAMLINVTPSVKLGLNFAW